MATISEGSIRKSDGDIYYASEYNKQMFQLGSGTITLLADQESWDVHYGDVAIAAGDLIAGDIIVVEMAGHNASTTGGGDFVQVRVDIDDVTTPVTFGGSDNIISNTAFTNKTLIAQDAGTNTYAVGGYSIWTFDTYQAGVRGDTGDANFMTSAFTIRVNSRYNGTSGAEDSYIRYVVYVLRG